MAGIKTGVKQHMQFDSLYKWFKHWSDFSSNMLFWYFFYAGGSFLVIYVWLKRKTWFANIQQRYPTNKRILLEILYSVIFFLILSLTFVCTGWLNEHHYVHIYKDIHEYGMVYFILSFPLSIFLHDTYYYWVHRLMHWRPIFKYVHKTHHRSISPTPFAAFSFHPAESVLQTIYFPIVVFFVPFHQYVILFFWGDMLITSILGHFGHEFVPRWVIRHKILKWSNTVTHHDLHHTNVKTNFGLYFNFWDTIMKTNTPHYKEHFEKVVDRREALKKEHKEKALNVNVEAQEVLNS